MRSPPGSLRGAPCGGRRLEGWDVVEVAAPFGLPLPAAAALAVPAASAALDFGRGPLEGDADLVGLDLGDRPLLSFGGLPAALAEPTGDHDAVALGEGVGQVLGLAAPDVDAQEAGVAVAPFAVLLDALGDRHP